MSFLSFIGGLICGDLLLNKDSYILLLFSHIKDFYLLNVVLKSMNNSVIKSFKQSLTIAKTKITDYLLNSYIGIKKDEDHMLTYIPIHNICNSYKIAIRENKDYSRIFSIKNEIGDDITDILLPYINPIFKFDKINISPSVFGLESFIIEFTSGSKVLYNSEDIVQSRVATLEDYIKEGDKYNFDYTLDYIPSKTDIRTHGWKCTICSNFVYQSFMNLNKHRCLI